MSCIKVANYEIYTDEIVSGGGNVEGGTQIIVFKSNAIGQQIKNFCGYTIRSSSIKNQKINPKLLINKNNQCFNILKLYGFDQQNDLNIYIGEKCDCCLQYYLTLRKQYPLNEQEIFNILGQIVNGYIDLQNQKIKLNLNLETIYLQKVDNQVIVKLFDYIYDFNIQEPYVQMAYNYRYLAPETLINSQNCDQRSDIFSLGIILYQICYLQHPYHQNQKNKQNLIQQYQQLNNQSINFPDSPNISNELKSLIKKMLIYNPNERITWQNLQANKKLNLKFVILDNLYYVNFDKQIGSGAQGVVYQAVNILNNQQFCAKRITNNLPESQREIKIYEQLLKQEQYNYNIIQIFQIISYDKQYTYIIMEKCEENLEEYYQNNKSNITESNVIEFLIQITNGYMFLKQNNIIHRDLKPQNILIKYLNQQPIFKILSKQDLATSLAGTPLFSAPEVFNEDGGNYNHQCDIYSLGAILYYMVYNQSYVNVQTLDQLKQKILQLKFQNIICPMENFQKKPVDQDIRDLIQQMIVYDPNKRMTWEKLKVRLEEINKNHIAKGLNQKIRIVNVSTQPFQQLNNQQIINQNLQSEEFNQNQQSNNNNGQIIKNVNQQNKIKILCQVNNSEQQNNLFTHQPQIIQVNQQQSQFQNQQNQQNYPLKQNNQELIQSINQNSSNVNLSYSQNLDKQSSVIQQQQNLQETQKASHTNSKTRIQSNFYNSKSIKQFKTLDEFQNYFIEFIINKKKTVIDIAEYIFFLIVASRKVYQVLINNIKDTQIEIIIILELIKLFIEVCIENLCVLQIKRYILLEDIDYEIEQNFLDEIMPQNFIILKREIRKQRPINNTIQGNNIYLQQIKIYHDRLSKQGCVTFLVGLTYFQEFYQEKAERLQLTEIQKIYLQKLYSITEIVKFTQNQYEFDQILQQFQ